LESLSGFDWNQRPHSIGIAVRDHRNPHLHDFRRTGVTVLARKGVRWEVADKLLNHAAGVIRGVAAVYQQHDFLAEREQAFVAWAAHVTTLGDGEKGGANVVELRGAIDRV
jgi:integrase